MSDGSETAAPLDTTLGPILKKILDARSDKAEDDATERTDDADALEEEAAEALRAYMGPGLQPPAQTRAQTRRHTTGVERGAQTAT